MSTVEAPVSTAESVALRIPFFGKIQNLVYSVGLTQVAVGLVSAIYVLITQAIYFGKSFKYTWDHLNLLWHFRAIPGIGPWLFVHYDIERHIYLRDAPESIVAFALIAAIIVKQLTLKDKTPIVDRILIFLHMPSRYQDRYGRKEDTTIPQYIFLLPSMLLASLPGLILSSAAIFGGMAIATKQGYHSAWLTPESPWVPIAIGIVGGALFGHKPAVKAGQDIQRFFLERRLCIAYAAEDILDEYRVRHTGEFDSPFSTPATADKITKMKASSPGPLYPPAYKLRYRLLRIHRAAVQEHGWPMTATIYTLTIVGIVLAGYGLYVRKYGVTHGYWRP